MQAMEAGAGVDVEIPPFVLAGIRIEIGDGAALLSRLPRTTTADLRIHCRRMRRHGAGLTTPASTQKNRPAEPVPACVANFWQ